MPTEELRNCILHTSRLKKRWNWTVASEELWDARMCLSPHYTRKKKGSFLHKYEESHTAKSIKDP